MGLQRAGHDWATERNWMEREMEDRKKNQMEILELKNISDVKNPMHRIKSRLDFVESIISKLK